MISLWYYSTREYKSDDCKSSFLSVQYLYFPKTLSVSCRLLAVFNSITLYGLLVVYDPFHLISTWFAWISYRISRNWFFFSNIFPYFGNRPWLEFPFISLHLHWTPKAKHLKCLEQIAKSPTKYRALSFSTGLLWKETPVLRSATLLQTCTSFRRHFLTLHSLITGKNRQETCDFSRFCL